MKKLWFKNKTFGYGYTPASWEGWLIFAVYILIIIGALSNIVENDALAPVITILFFTGVFIWISKQHGEPLEAHFGKKKHAERTEAHKEAEVDAENKKEE